MNHALRVFDEDDRSSTAVDCHPGDPYVSIVVPTYHEAANLSELTVRLFAAVSVAQFNAELIVVDDNSNDGTMELCEELAAMYPVRLVTRTDERGLATAVIRGLREARGKFVVVMDADLSHPPMSMPALLTPLEAGSADFVIGSRYVQGGSVDESWSVFRHLNSRIAGWLAYGLTKAKDPMAGFFAVRRSQLGELSCLNPCGYKIGLEVMVRCGCQRIVEVPIHFEDRKHGESKLSLPQQWLYLQHLFRLYAFRFPEVLRFAKFGAVGASGLLIDVVLLRTLLPVVGMAAGRALAIWLAMSWNFELNRRLIFRHPHPQRSDLLTAYSRFCTACSLGAVISWGTSVGLMCVSAGFSRHPIAAAVFGTFVAASVNFALCRRWVFRMQEPAPAIVTDRLHQPNSVTAHSEAAA